jgi:hypothetical protein
MLYKSASEPEFQNILKKLVYNRSSSGKFKHRYFYRLEDTNPIITISSRLILPERFLPYYSSRNDLERFNKIKLMVGETINCLDRNLILIEGLVMVLNDRF